MIEYCFTQTINTPQLQDEIMTAGLSLPDVISSNGTSVVIQYSVSLSSDQLIELGTVVANHVVNSDYVTLAVQADIATLVGYLNSSTLSVAQTARATIIANIAPRMPPNLIATINSQIASLLGS